MATSQLDWMLSYRELADANCSIVTLLTKYGISVPEVHEQGSIKIHCIWDFQHADGGIETAMRVYGSPFNHAYCYAGCGRITPSRLYAEQESLPVNEAAKRLLEEFGYKPLTWRERVERSMGILTSPPPIDLQAYSMALTINIKTLVGDREYDPDVIEFIQRALADDLLYFFPDRWLTTWKQRAQESLLTGPPLKDG